jgi:hypothetical protein
LVALLRDSCILALWQSGGLYVVEMRSCMRYTNWDGSIGRPWVYRATFDTLQAAPNHAAEVADDPRRYGHVDGDSSTGSLSDGMGRGRDHKRIIFSYEWPASLDDGSLAESIVAGHMPYPAGPPPGQMIAPSFGEAVHQLWGLTEPGALAALLSFTREAPLRYGHRSHWTWLYKRAEEAGDRDVLAVLIASQSRASRRGASVAGEDELSACTCPLCAGVNGTRRPKNVSSRPKAAQPSPPAMSTGHPYAGSCATALTLSTPTRIRCQCRVASGAA